MNKELFLKYFQNYEVKIKPTKEYYGGIMKFGRMVNGYPSYKYIVLDPPTYSKYWIIEYYKCFLNHDNRYNIVGNIMNYKGEIIRSVSYTISYDKDKYLMNEDLSHPEIKIYNDKLMLMLSYFKFKNRKIFPDEKKNNLLNTLLVFKKYNNPILPEEMVFMILGFIRLIEI